MSRYRSRNPLPVLQTKVEDALALIQKITENAEKSGAFRRNPYDPKWDRSILGKDLDPEQIYTPMYIVVKNLEPPVRKEVLRILYSDDAPFYEAVIREMEGKSENKYNSEIDEPLPSQWMEARTRRAYGKDIPEPSFLESAYEDAIKYGEFKNYPDSYANFRDVLSYKKVPVRRKKGRRQS